MYHDEVVTIPEIRRLAAVSKATSYAWARQLGAFRVLGQLVVLREDLEAFLERRRATQSTATDA